MNNNISDLIVQHIEEVNKGIEDDAKKRLILPFKSLYKDATYIYTNELEKSNINENKAVLEYIDLSSVDNKINEPIKELKKENKTIIKDELKTAIIAGYVFQKGITKEFFNEKIKVKEPKKELISELLKYEFKGASVNERIYKLGEDLNFEIKQLIKAGIQNNTPQKLMAEEINKRINISLGRAMTIVRTEVNRTLNQSRYSAMVEDKYKYIMFSAILDNRTSGICKERDGKIYEINKVSIDNLPPLHPNCRSTIIPYIEEKKGIIEKAKITYNAFKKKYF